MAVQKYDNFWTKLGLGNLRGNKEFKSLWRAVRVSALYGGLKLLELLASGTLTLPEWVNVALPVVSVALEKWLRERIKVLDF